MNDRLLKRLILETIKEVLAEGMTPEKRKELKRKEKELLAKYEDLDEERLEIDDEIHLVEEKLQDPKLYKITAQDKVSLRKELAVLKKKMAQKTKEVDAAWETYEATRKKLGPNYDSRRERDKD